MTLSEAVAPQQSAQHVQVLHADALTALSDLPDGSVHAVVTDPPYGLTTLTTKKVQQTLAAWASGNTTHTPSGKGFMGNTWDRFVPPPALWTEALRVLKPGGFLVAFAGARTVDLMGMSLRLAGFEIRDMVAWIRADTFAKAPGILKSGHEPVVIARRPFDGTLENNMKAHGVGALNIEGSRTPYRGYADEAETKTKNAHGRFGTRHGGNAVFGEFGDDARSDYDAPGRWPTNVVLSPEVAGALDDTSGSDPVGGPSRFFPVMYAGRAPVRERPIAPDGVKHPTVKPLSVMEWLVGLVSFPGQLVLDPFGGSGTTAEACIRLGRDCVIVERERTYLPLIAQRVERAQTVLGDVGGTQEAP